MMERVAEDGVRFVQPTPHADVLQALAREQECDLGAAQ